SRSNLHCRGSSRKPRGAEMSVMVIRVNDRGASLIDLQALRSRVVGMPGIMRQVVQAMEWNMAQVRARVVVDVIELPQQRPKTNRRDQGGEARHKCDQQCPSQPLQRKRHD